VQPHVADRLRLGLALLIALAVAMLALKPGISADKPKAPPVAAQPPGPAVFCDSDYAYLRRILPLPLEVSAQPGPDRPPCLD